VRKTNLGFVLRRGELWREKRGKEIEEIMERRHFQFFGICPDHTIQQAKM